MGEPGSQMYPDGGGGMDVVPLWRRPLPRITQKQRAPPWWSQVAEAKRTLRKLERLPMANQLWEGRPVTQWLEERGAVTYTTIQGVLSTLHADIKRARVLGDLEETCRERESGIGHKCGPPKSGQNMSSVLLWGMLPSL